MDQLKKLGRSPASKEKSLFAACSTDVVDLQAIASTSVQVTVYMATPRVTLPELNATVDSGSAVSFVSADLARSLRLRIDASRRVEFHNVNGNRAMSAGCTRIEVTTTGKKSRVTFYVASKLPDRAGPRWSMIVGTDLLKAVDLVLDFSQETIYWEEQADHR